MCFGVWWIGSYGCSISYHILYCYIFRKLDQKCRLSLPSRSIAAKNYSISDGNFTKYPNKIYFVIYRKWEKFEAIIIPIFYLGGFLYFARIAHFWYDSDANVKVYEKSWKNRTCDWFAHFRIWELYVSQRNRILIQ